ncbi:MAG: ABC transporter ATP-binding protein [Caldiserica bacterium]|nr:ABC transporter ATP-binding protein [Caldisericota bacterium]
MARDVLIDLRHIIKVFPPDTVALADVSVSFESGEIHALVGENGAGKSTLMKVFYGLERRDAGEIFFRGAKVEFRTPREAISAGIGMVHQEILLIPEYTVWQNIVLGSEPVRAFGTIDVHKARQAVRQEIEEFQFNLEADALVGDISVAARQKVEILKLLYRNVSVLILDEPTAVLTPQEIPQLFSELMRLRDKGHTIIFISHRLDEVLTLSDRVTVMRHGKVVGTSTASDLTKEDLARQMVGREVLFTSQRRPQEPGEIVFRAEGLNCSDTEHRARLHDATVTVHAGEIVGVAGVEGNGQFQLVNAIMGLAPMTSGTLEVSGKDITHADILARRALISFVPQDRAKMGASVAASILEDSIMTHHILDPSFSTMGGLGLDYQRATAFTEQIRKQFSVDMGSAGDPFHSLSGGNQQKVILGRELLLETPFVLMDQPTRGLDVGSIEYVHQLLLDLRSRKRAVLLVSADLDELFMVADRIVVMCQGNMVADLATDGTSREEVGYYMLGGKEAVHAQAGS